MEAILQIFAKLPEKGKVKTRLASQTNEDFAFKTAQLSLDLLCHKASLYWQGKIELWLANIGGNEIQALNLNLFANSQLATLSKKYPRINLRRQQGHNLGDKMLHAMQHARSNNSQAVIIGADIPHIDIDTLQKYFALASAKKSFIGPCEDGGYYVISSANTHPKMFNGVTWGSDTAYMETIRSCQLNNIYFDETLALFYDLDYMDDLERVSLIEPSFKKLLTEKPK